MPQIDSPSSPLSQASSSSPPTTMDAAPQTLRDIFPPVRKSHVLNCSYPNWHATYKSITPKARTIPISPEFLSYLREDGIVLPDDENRVTSLSDDEDCDSDEEDTAEDPSLRFPEFHQMVKDTIAELGGHVAPKLNWSSPKDALFISATNTLECRTPSDIYLLLKSSDFITHDLEHAFDGCSDDPAQVGEAEVKQEDIHYHLILRKWFQLNPSVEFRCFVRNRKLLGATQRDLNHFEFLHQMQEELLDDIEDFFEDKLKHTFPDPDFVFDVYIPQTDNRKKVWLIDINPFAPRTDPILFSWMELLDIPTDDEDREVELRLVKKDDPEAYSFNTPQYSTSKMPQEVIEAGLNGDEAIWEFAARWREIVDGLEGRGDGTGTA